MPRRVETYYSPQQLRRNVFLKTGKKFGWKKVSEVKVHSGAIEVTYLVPDGSAEAGIIASGPTRVGLKALAGIKALLSMKEKSPRNG